MADNHGLHVEFYIESVQRAFKSEEAGRPIFEDVEFIKILIPGDKNYSVEREANKADFDRFPLEYARFKNGMKEAEQAIGTPLSQWPAMSRSMAKEFNAMNVFTVEQLAGMSDQGKQAFGMGALEWSVKAKAYLDAAGGGAAIEKYAAENETLKRDMETMRQEIAELSARSDKKRGPGRPTRSDAVREMVEID